MELSQNNLNLHYSTPIVTSDGHIVMLSDQGVPTLVFFQARDAHDGHMHADVVAAVRLNNLEDLRNLDKAIKETIKKHQDREP
ncbi:MAG TPA: hypothetical protein VMT23_03860 [Candidatus Binatia bacterium]|nr:hypothetical protein [Candidatus Binatia bacterium]